MEATDHEKFIVTEERCNTVLMKAVRSGLIAKLLKLM